MNIDDLRVQVLCGADSCASNKNESPFVVSAFMAIMNAFFEFCVEQPK